MEAGIDRGTGGEWKLRALMLGLGVALLVVMVWMRCTAGGETGNPRLREVAGAGA